MILERDKITQPIESYQKHHDKVELTKSQIVAVRIRFKRDFPSSPSLVVFHEILFTILISPDTSFHSM
jgi:hypothetical protein